jgi:hypothetical protein
MPRQKIYLLFSFDSLPQQDEVDIFNGSIALLQGKYQVGEHMRTHALAIEFDREIFEHARKTDFNFEVLISTWEKHGAQIEDSLPFLPAKDDKTIPTKPKEEKLTPKALLRAKKMDASEAVARSRLDVYNTTQNVERFKGVAKVVPYALVGLGSMLTAAAGYKAYTALQNSGMEPRSKTIQKMIEEENAPKNKKFADKAAKPEENPGDEKQR